MKLNAGLHNVSNDKILRNLINTREVASFIDNVIIRTEEKKEYDEVVEEVGRKKFVYKA